MSITYDDVYDVYLLEVLSCFFFSSFILFTVQFIQLLCGHTFLAYYPHLFFGHFFAKMHAFYFTIMLAGLQKYAQAATVGDLAVEFNAAALSLKDGIVAEGKLAYCLCVYERKMLICSLCSRSRQWCSCQNRHSREDARHLHARHI